ncbi:hypothetical protein EV1_014868 [Malus domestica]
MILIHSALSDDTRTVVDSVELELTNMDLKSISSRSLPDPHTIRNSSHLVGPKVLQSLTLCKLVKVFVLNLNAISLLAPVLGSELTCSRLVPVIVTGTASKDRVPNIKFNVAKVLQSIIPIVDQSVVEKTIRPCLLELSEDSHLSTT